MADYKALLDKKRELEAQIEAAYKAEVGTAIDKVRAIVSEFGLSSADIFGGRKTPKVPSTVAPKYRDPATGQTWTGRGKPPRWIADKDRTQFAI